jgi:hypothetical protein
MVLAATSSFARLASVPDTYIGIWRRYLNGKIKAGREVYLLVTVAVA